MRILLLAGAVAAAAPLVFAASPVTAQTQPAAKVDSRAVIEAVRKALRENYVIKERRPALDAALAKGLASGRYAVTDPQELSTRINDDLAAVAHDKHLSINFDPRVAAELAAGRQNDEVADSAFWRALARRNNHGVSELKVLPGNVRMLRYDGFMWTGDESRATLDNAVAFLRGGDAIVIDIRDNGGGSPEAVRRLTSYFVPAGAKLVTFHMRDEKPTVSVADTEVPGGRITGVPVYVLTSGRSASAAEEFASHVKGFGFGTLVGETTAGAGYRNDSFTIPGGFALSVSVGRPELPDGSDWEAKGVAPKLAVARDLALDRAHQDALTRLAAKAQGPEKTELEWSAALAGARIEPVTPARPLDAYAGRYGLRTVKVESGALVYQREGNPKTALVPLGADLFALESDPRTRVRFVLVNGAVTGFVLERVDGTIIEVQKA
ncbi:MAG: S41 family peptidase [Sphingomonas sp.]|uniref:S41 family peptidase n=1 Tax=Sphingomonas sp. TaxID=28214 RepID=UPI002274CE80|nr:S41 family peptidase [Sphingomonas sp.]MCX8474269.1 S41 family peptidase [Sphingomonas sp.]